MKFRQFSNEKGMTLVELLAALSLFAVVIVLSSTVLIQLVDSEEKTSNSIALKQDTNILMSQLRSQYYNGKDQLCITEEKYKIKFTEISNGDVNEEGCIENISAGKPLSVKVTATSHDEVLSIKTTWTNPQQHVLNLSERFEIPDDVNGECIFKGDTTFKDKFFKNDPKICNDTFYVTGNATFQNSKIKQGITLFIKDNLVVRDGITIKNSVHIKSWGSADFKGQISLHQKAKIIIINDATFHGSFNQKGTNGSICVKGKKSFPENINDEEIEQILNCL